MSALASIPIAELVEERRTALADVAALFTGQQVVQLPHGLSLLKPYGLDTKLHQLDHNALRKPRGLMVDHATAQIGKQGKRPTHRRQRPEASTAPADAWPPEASSQLDASFDKVGDSPFNVQESDRIRELQDELEKLKAAVSEMQLRGSGGPTGDGKDGGAEDEWWADGAVTSWLKGETLTTGPGDSDGGNGESVDLGWLENEPLVPDIVRENFERYLEIFKEADRNSDGLIEASDARRVMDQSDLPPFDLAHVWAICDEDRDGRLTPEEFLCAMHLIAMRREGEPLPNELPMELVEMAEAVASENPVARLSPQEPLQASWEVLARGMAEYRDVFQDLDPGGTGFVHVEDAWGIIEKSQLPAEDLSYILKLCDVDYDGRLSFGEFVGALHLVSRRRDGSALPTSLPPDVSTVILSTTGMAPFGSSARSRWFIKPENLKKYHVIFQALDQLGEGTAAGAPVREVLERSQVGHEDLARIWELCDMDGDGRLGVDEFICAMHIAHQVRLGAPLPMEMPFELASMAAIAKATLPSTKRVVKQKPGQPPPDFTSPWVVTPQHWNKYRTIFHSVDKEGYGLLSPEEARILLERSMLPHGELAKIWQLADKDLDGQLSAAEFTVAMHLVFRKRQGYELPLELPTELAITAEVPQVMGESVDPGTVAPNLPPNVLQAAQQSWGAAGGAETAAADGTWSVEVDSSSKEQKAAGGLLGKSDGVAAAGGDAATVASAGAPAARAASSAAAAAKPPAAEKKAVAGATAEGSAAPKDAAASMWVVSQSRLKQIAVPFMKNVPGDGLLPSTKAAKIMKGTGLPEAELGAIWNISVVNQDGKLGFAEYICAMHLIDLRLAGVPLPNALPEEFKSFLGQLPDKPHPGFEKDFGQ